MGEKVRVGAGRRGRGWAGGWRKEARTELPGANQSEGRGWELPRGAPRGGGGSPQMLLGVGWGAVVLRSQCLTFFSTGAKGRGPRVRRVLFRAPVCLSVVGFCFQGGEASCDRKSFPSPSRPPAIFGGPVWILVWLGSHEDVGPFNKGERHRELGAGAGLVWVLMEV